MHMPRWLGHKHLIHTYIPIHQPLVHMPHTWSQNSIDTPAACVGCKMCTNHVHQQMCTNVVELGKSLLVKAISLYMTGMVVPSGRKERTSEDLRGPSLSSWLKDKNMDVISLLATIPPSVRPPFCP